MGEIQGLGFERKIAYLASVVYFIVSFVVLRAFPLSQSSIVCYLYILSQGWGVESSGSTKGKQP